MDTSLCVGRNRPRPASIGPSSRRDPPDHAQTSARTVTPTAAIPESHHSLKVGAMNMRLVITAITKGRIVFFGKTAINSGSA